MNFEVRRGEVVSLLGRNGAGKSTTLRTIVGLMRRSSGSVRLHGEEILGQSPEKIARRGLAWCPEERGIFASLSVAENLHLPPVVKPGGMTEDELLSLFPNLRERWRSSGGKLSGGEQQMLAIARILRTGADILLLDEPTEGLAPVIVQQIAEVVKAMKARGLTVVLVEQNYRFAARLADRHYVVEHGQVIDQMDRAGIEKDGKRIESYLRA
ncbi:ABC transporter ATP-binding protein [Oceanibium sediminis]|uniref:ABC transporter ATP-binding protein n=1 Tax=Oceanibium sediminis TaxID=2026339 RepID=UPI000DD4C2C5|nr:ABC transporter ATP-binding protein [Oceanibium sediminis]